MFDERADGNAGKEIIANAKREYDQAKADLAKTNKAIRDFESGNASGTGAIDFTAEQEMPKQTTPTQKIEDFGEKIGGAKKDIYERLSEITTDDLESKPLSKSFPLPDFKKLVDDGVLTTEQAILLKFLYESIPAKPRKPYLVKTWANKVQYVIDTYNELFSGSNIDVVGRLRDSSILGNKFKMYEEIHNEFGFPANPANMGGYEIKKFTNAGGSYYAVVKGSYIKSRDLYSIKDAVEVVKSLVDKNKEAKNTIKFNIYQNKKTEKYSIGKKGANDVVKLVEFDTLPEAREFLKDNQEQLENMWNAMKITQSERRDFNRNRKGEDHRKGKDVTPEEFGKQFGFRGVEFGNWVNNAERQGSLNAAYDAFMDLALALGVQPRALSLNGQLALAFGARGSGGKNPPSAHYEPGKVVINLTKKHGAGSLAHEWWHGLDNYFERTRGRKDNFLTDSPRVRVNRDNTPQTEVRPAVIEAFKNLINTIEKSDLNKRSKEADKVRSKPYFGTPIEMSARAFENFVAEKLAESGIENDYLVNFKDQAEWIKGGVDVDNYPYPTKDESADLNKAYQALFDTVEQKQEGDNIALFQIANTPFTPIPQSTYDKLVKRLLGVFKKFGGKVITTKAEVDAKLKEFGVADYMIKAFHGSPHRFDKFSTDYMGSGEGAQAFGWGLYFTDLKEIAEQYTTLGGYELSGDIEGYDKEDIAFAEEILATYIRDMPFDDVLKQIKIVRDGYTSGLNARDKERYYKWNKTLSILSNKNVKYKNKGTLYTVNLHEGKTPEQYTWLEWDKPLSEKALDVFEIFKNQRGLVSTREEDAKKYTYELYNAIARRIGAKNASLFLLENGIDGIKYPAESVSRGATSDTARGFNYVVFDENAVTIDEVVEFMKTKDGEIYGAKFPDGTIYLNPEKVNANTPIHEFSHLWQQLMPSRFKKGVELLKNTPIGKRTFAELKANEGYANKSDDELWNEALVTVMGNEGERIFNSSRASKFKEWLTDLFKALGNAFGIRDLSPNDKLSTFVKGTLSEVMGTKEIIPESRIENSEVPIYVKRMSNTDIKEMLNNLGLITDAVCP